MKINMTLKFIAKKFSVNEGYNSQTGMTITYEPQEISISTKGTKEVNKIIIEKY